METVTTGLSGLDAQLGGGVPRGSTILLLGDPSNALALFAEQFAAGGLMAHEVVHVYEFDRTLRGMEERVWGYTTNGAREKAKLVLHDGYTTQFGKGLLPRAEEPAANVLAVDRKNGLQEVLDAVLSVGYDKKYRLVVDSLSGLLTKDNTTEILDFVKTLVHVGNELSGVQLVTIVRGLHDPTFVQHLKHLATGVMEIGVERKGFGAYSVLEVSKMQNVADSVKLLLFRETDKGLWLESTKRVF
ncbi:MAG: RAD55 family ATPase [Methanobacteriota archaeon]